MSTPIEQMRLTIDEIDQHLIELFARRSICVRQISKIKTEQDLAIYDAKREGSIIDKIKTHNTTLYHQIDLINIFQAVLRAGLHLQLVERSE